MDLSPKSRPSHTLTHAVTWQKYQDLTGPYRSGGTTGPGPDSGPEWCYAPRSDMVIGASGIRPHPYFYNLNVCSIVL